MLFRSDCFPVTIQLAKNLNVDADKKAGVDTKVGIQNIEESKARVNQITETINNLKADTNLKGSQEQLNTLQQNSVKIANDFNIENNKTLLEENIAILRRDIISANVSEATENDAIKLIKENIKNVISNTLLNNAKSAEAKQSVKLMQNEIAQITNNITLSNKQFNLDYEKFKQEWNMLVYKVNHKGVLTENIRGFTEMIYQAIHGEPHTSENK